MTCVQECEIFYCHVGFRKGHTTKENLNFHSNLLFLLNNKMFYDLWNEISKEMEIKLNERIKTHQK